MVYIYFGVSGGSYPLRFYLDSEQSPVGHYKPWFTATNDLQFNQLVFKSDQLQHDQHTLRMEVSEQSGACFDYAVYTADRDDGESNATTRTANLSPTVSGGGKMTGSLPGTAARETLAPEYAKAVGAAIAAVAAALLAVGAWWMIRRRGRGAREGDTPAAFVAQPNPERAAPSVKKYSGSFWHETPKTTSTATLGAEDSSATIGFDGDRQWDFDPSSASDAFPRSPLSGLPGIEDMQHELARVRAENERARAEIEFLREVAEQPPPYPNDGRAREGPTA